MLQNTSSKVVVLGGGSAGWLTALFVKRNWPRCDVTVVEDPKRPPIIAGESGSTTFVTLLKHLKIDNNDFIKQVNATPKLGGKFTNWNGVGSEFIHCLQTDYAPWLDGWTDHADVPMAEITFGMMTDIMKNEKAKDQYLRTLVGNDIPLANAFYAGEFIKQNKVPFGPGDHGLPVVPMWHFESREAAGYFKRTGLSRGINLVEGEYQYSTQNEKGDITSIMLNGNRTLDADWFFDCSGFARLLLGKVYNEKVVDETNTFPARAVVAWWDETCPCVTTNAIAMKYGWSWNINIRNRSGNGYIYDPDHITLDQAVQEAEEYFGKKIDPVANFQYQPGMMRNLWKNNVIAVGLSSGFLEPLEANGIAIIVETLFGLQDYWNPSQKDYPESTLKRMNDRIWFIAEDIKDFLALHYRGQRRDTDFWRSHGEDEFRIPESLRPKLEEWRDYYDLKVPEPWPKAYSAQAWMMVIQGLRIFNHSKFTESLGPQLLETGKKVLNSNETRYKALVDPFWSIEEWIKNTA